MPDPFQGGGMPGGQTAAAGSMDPMMAALMGMGGGGMMPGGMGDPAAGMQPMDPSMMAPAGMPSADGSLLYPGMRIPSGDELYNTLMGKIEPELTTDQLPLLEERYKAETPEESRARGKRYQEAFAEYDKQLREYMDGLQQKLRAHQRIAMSSAELGARAEEQDALKTIEANIQKL